MDLMKGNVVLVKKHQIVILFLGLNKKWDKKNKKICLSMVVGHDMK